MTNAVGDNRGNLVQAGVIHGGVHFHARRMPPPDQVPRATPHFTNQRQVLASADSAFARTPDDGRSGLRFLVFTGPPGVGKREAARMWVWSHRDDFPDGLFHADLTDARPGAEAEHLGDFLVAAGFAAEQIPSSFEGRASLFRSWTATRQVVVVVERALTPAQVRALAPSGDRSAVVVTESNRLDGLTARAAAAFLEVAPLEDSAALDLFERIAGQERIRTEPEAVREALRIADGLPIAICVIASMVAAHPHRTMTRLVAQLRDEQKRLAALSRGGGDLSITTVFNTAYARLPEPAKVVYQAAGMHPGVDAFGVEVLAAALGWDEDAVLDELDVLAGARLVTELPGDRYAMHSLVRAHARQAGADAERQSVLRATIAFYRDRAVAAGHAVMPGRGWWELLFPNRSVPALPAGLDARGWLETERENLRAAVDAAFLLGEHRTVQELCVMLWPLHERGKHLDDLAHCDQLGLESATIEGNTAVAALMTIQLGVRHVHLGEPREAGVLFERARVLAEQGPHVELVATALESQGLAHIAAGEVTRAEQVLSENLDLARQLAEQDPGDQSPARRVALARFHLAKVAPLTAALDLLAQAQQAFLDLTPADDYNAGKAVQWRGRRLAEDPARAGEAHVALTQAQQALVEPFDRMTTLEAFGDLASRSGDKVAAASRYREALTVAETNDYPHDTVRLLGKLADLDQPDDVSGA